MESINEILQFILLNRYLKRKKHCSKECEKYCDVCDCCKYFDYNGKDLIEDNKTFKGAINAANGWCRFHKKKKNPWDICEEFICENVKE